MSKRVEFTDDVKVLHIELGAGCGNFGTMFHPKCYTTDVDDALMGVCKPLYLDRIVDAFNLPWADNRFSKVLMCNPFGFGFDQVSTGCILIRELARVLKDESDIIIIGSNRNKYCRPDNIAKSVQEFSSDNKEVEISSVESIDPTSEYSGYKFYTTGSVNETKPNLRITLYVRQKGQIALI